jgi:four helix bundle protein
MNTYRDLLVWQKGVALVVLVYKETSKCPKEEVFGLTSQMRRCAVSIPSNIAEGKMRESQKEFKRFLYIAYGSGAELETQIEIAKKLSYMQNSSYNQIEQNLSEIMKMLNVMISRLRV